MAKFVYRMQSILNIKEKLEQQERANYGLALSRLHEEEDKLRGLVVRRAGYETRAKELRGEGILDLREMEFTRRAVESMKVLIRSQMLEVKRAEKDVERARRKLTEVMQERKMHERLREKAFEEFKEELDHEEGKQVDQLVSYTYSAR